MLSPIIAPPASISPEDHAQLTSSTPSSFSDIPPVLRWSDQVEIELSSTNGGWESWPSPKSQGKLYVTEESVAFIPNPPSTIGFNLPYTALTLHALTPASSGGPAHLYCQIDDSDAAGVSGQLDTQVNGDAMAEDEEDDDDRAEEDEYTEMREVRIYLSDISKLEPLFQALSQCSALHASLLPNGEPSSFFGFGGDESEGEDGQWDDAPEDDDSADGPGRVNTAVDDKSRENEQDQASQVVDQMERFLSLVDWRNVKKPDGWDASGH
ncbi:chloride channel nucleotide-sensitive 1A [Cryptococcus deuterogattii R265]|uniref:chloride channel nucleotide-sensitive 1A n=1 Tax=Cryptococcus deuterogattii (strain R265) TaxID=294750 RepID=UPI001934D438|nr:chloride channel nucleotide-sensitive 1A [Cryptococcus deuterogattii R265]